MIIGQPQVQDREHEQVVPEDVPAVGLAVQSARRHPDVEVDAVGRHRLQQMQKMQSQDAQFIGEVVELDGEALPQMCPP